MLGKKSGLENLAMYLPILVMISLATGRQWSSALKLGTMLVSYLQLQAPYYLYLLQPFQKASGFRYLYMPGCIRVTVGTTYLRYTLALLMCSRHTNI